MRSGLARLAIPVVAVVVFAAMLGWFGLRRTASVATPPSVALATPPEEARTATAPAKPNEANAQGETPKGGSANPSTATLTPAQQPDPKAGANPSLVVPSFDVVRVEPTGESVIAGRAAPGATVDLMSNGGTLARAMADPSGLFAFVPPRLPPGSHEIMLQTIAPDGTRARSAQSVTVAIAEKQDAPPLVAVSTPGQPTVVLSRPDDVRAPAPPATLALASPPPAPPSPATPVAKPSPAVAAKPATASSAPTSPGATPPSPPAVASARRPDVRIASVEAEGTGRLFVSGSAAPGATLRLYLNDSFVAPGGTRPDGNLSFTIERGIRPGDYHVRLDDVDPVSGTVRSRAEVPFNVPSPAVVASADPANPGQSQTVAKAAPATPPQPRASAARTFPPATEGAAPVRDAETGNTASPTATGTATAQGPVAGATPAQEPTTSFASRQTEPGAMVVPEVNTALVSRGDNLWRISKRAYGSGLRYTVIYGANQPQIRNPSLIYPGQVFVVPAGRDQVSR